MESDCGIKSGLQIHNGAFAINMWIYPRRLGGTNDDWMAMADFEKAAERGDLDALRYLEGKGE